MHTVWIATTGDWNVSTHWDPEGVPGVGDNALIGNADAFVNYANGNDPLLDSLKIESDSLSGAFATLQHHQESLSTKSLYAGNMVLGYWAGAEGGHDMGSAQLNAAIRWSAGRVRAASSRVPRAT